MKKCSASSIIGKCKSKIQWGHIIARRAIIKRKKERKADTCWWDMDKLEPVYTFNGNKNGVVAIGNSTGVP